MGDTNLFRPATPRTSSLLFLALAGLVSAPTHAAASGGAVAYAEAGSELDNGRPRSYVYNAVDGKPSTQWCSSPRKTKETLVVGFTKPTKVTHFGMIAGALKKDALDPKRHRIKRVAVSDGTTRRELVLKNSPDLQEVELKPPSTTTRLVIDILEVEPGSDPLSPVCVAELSLLSGKRSLTGDEVAKRVRGLSTPARRMLHSWVDEVSAPESTLTFAVDGTFQYVFEPLLEGEPVTLKGKWFAGHRKLTLDVRGKKYNLKTKLSRIDDGDGQTTELVLVGKAPHDSLNRSFRPAPPRYE